MNSDLEHWQRLSPLSIIFFLGKSVVRLIKDALPTFAPVAIVIFASGNRLTTTTFIAAGLAALLIGGAILQFWFFKFRRDGDKVLINDGVFQKNHRVIRFERVQNINILTPVYFRPFGLTILQIETAGSKGNEADLAGVPAALAAHLRSSILEFQQSNVSVDGEQLVDNNNPEKGTVVASASLSDLVAYGVSSNGVFWLLAVLAPIFGASFGKFDDIISDNFSKIEALFGEGLAAIVTMGTVLLLGLLVLMYLFSILGAIYRYYGYELTKNQQTLKRNSGLITRFEESLKLVKVQTFITQSNIIGRWIKRQNIILGQVVSSASGKPGKKNLFIVPARVAAQVPELIKLVFADAPVVIAEERIDRRYILKTWLVSAVLPLTIVSLVFAPDSYWYFVIPLALALLALLLVIKRWSMFRFGVAGGYGVFQSGLFGFKRTLFPLHKIQQVEIQQSPQQRYRNLATLKISLASNQIRIPYIPTARAEQWQELIRLVIATNKSLWY